MTEIVSGIVIILEMAAVFHLRRLMPVVENLGRFLRNTFQNIIRLRYRRANRRQNNVQRDNIGDDDIPQNPHGV